MKRLIVSCSLLLLWGLFLFLCDERIVEFVCYVIAGWQVGGWSGQVSRKL